MWGFALHADHELGTFYIQRDLHYQVTVAKDASRYDTYKLMWKIRITKFGDIEADVDKHQKLISADDFDFLMRVVAGQARTVIEYFQVFLMNTLKSYCETSVTLESSDLRNCNRLRNY